MEAHKIQIRLDWSRLLGFDQVVRGAAAGETRAALLAKVGTKVGTKAGTKQS
jgi:hypothetical protein